MWKVFWVLIFGSSQTDFADYSDVNEFECGLKRGYIELFKSNGPRQRQSDQQL